MLDLRSEPNGTATIEDEIAATEAACRHALDSSGFGLIGRGFDLPADPETWFHLLWGVPQDPERVRRLRQIRDDAERDGGQPPGTIGRYAILQGFVAVLPQIAALPVDRSVLAEFCATAQRVAARPKGWRTHFDCESDAFQELAWIVTLRRFHAGQLSFDIMTMPRTWLLKIHPLALPSALRHMVFTMGGINPIAMPHLNYWRANPIVMLQSENERSMWRIAKSIEQQPLVKGLIGASWLYCRSLGEVTPHLAWIRQFFEDNGAFLIDMEPAPSRSGFMIGNETRRRLYAEGVYRPRQTLVLWAREDMLRWAAAYPSEPAGERGQPSVHPVDDATPPPQTAAIPSTVTRLSSSGLYTIRNCERFLTDKPRRYVLNVFLIPWLLLVGASLLWFGLDGAALTALVAPMVIWVLQYIFLQ